MHLDEALIARLAGERSFERGERYHKAGRLSPLEEVGEELRATMVGTERYRVALRPGDPLDWSCSCPMGRDGALVYECRPAGKQKSPGEGGTDPWFAPWCRVPCGSLLSGPGLI